MAALICIFTHLLLIITLAKGQSVNLTSPLNVGQNFYCDQDKVSCSGFGTVIQWTAPPSIPDNAPEGFASNEMQQSPVRFGNVEITLTNVVPSNPPLLTSELTLSNISEVNVTCQTEVDGSLETLPLIRSSRPSDVTSPAITIIFDAVEVTWRNNDTNYDPSHYTLQLFANNTLTGSVVISAESNRSVAEFTAFFSATEFNTSFSGTVNVRAKITVTSRCNQTSDGVFTETFTITSATDTIPTTSASITTEYVIWVLLSAATVVLAIV